jgi:nucleotide-binding universal stress UspA family protein
MNTMRPGSVVVGVDESALEGQAVRWAAEQAALEGRSVVLVHAAPLPATPWSVHQMAAPVEALAEARRAGQALLDRARDVVRATAPDVEVDLVLGMAPARTLILEVAERASLVVLGSHGRGPTSSRVLGSVGVSVVRHARCPVVVHRPGQPSRVLGGVVVAVEANADAVPVLEEAFHQASLRRLPLQVVHYVVAASYVMAGVLVMAEPDDVVAQDAVDLAEAMAGLRERYPDVPVRVRQDRGLPEQELARAAEQADLLVVGSRQKGMLERVLVGSVAVAVLERATCPVEVVPIGADRLA